MQILIGLNPNFPCNYLALSGQFARIAISNWIYSEVGHYWADIAQYPIPKTLYPK